jgi:hypothetical protein
MAVTYQPGAGVPTRERAAMLPRLSITAASAPSGRCCGRSTTARRAGSNAMPIARITRPSRITGTKRKAMFLPSVVPRATPPTAGRPVAKTRGNGASAGGRRNPEESEAPGRSAVCSWPR